MQNASGDLIARLQAADDAAAEELFRRYGHRIAGLARQRLQRTLQAKLDPEDVLQSVCRSFFRRLEEGQLQLSDEEALWNLLATITTRKCINRHSFFNAQRRAVDREIRLSSIAADDQRSPVSGDPTASAVAILLETIEQALAGFSAREREMVRRSLEGYTIREISDLTDRAERTIRRVLARARKTLSLVNA